MVAVAREDEGVSAANRDPARRAELDLGERRLDAQADSGE
jgi:hypothetical protein